MMAMPGAVVEDDEDDLIDVDEEFHSGAEDGDALSMSSSGVSFPQVRTPSMDSNSTGTDDAARNSVIGM